MPDIQYFHNIFTIVFPMVFGGIVYLLFKDLNFTNLLSAKFVEFKYLEKTNYTVLCIHFCILINTQVYIIIP